MTISQCHDGVMALFPAIPENSNIAFERSMNQPNCPSSTDFLDKTTKHFTQYLELMSSRSDSQRQIQAMIFAMILAYKSRIISMHSWKSSQMPYSLSYTVLSRDDFAMLILQTSDKLK